jgi:hypothetical protein
MSQMYSEQGKGGHGRIISKGGGGRGQAYSKECKAPKGPKNLTLGSVPDGAPGCVGASGVLMHGPLARQKTQHGTTP